MSEKIDTRNHPVIKALAEHRERLGISDSEFCRTYLNLSKTTWSQLQSGNYPAKDLTDVFEKCEAGLQMLADQAERAEVKGGSTIVQLTHVRALLSAIKGCDGAAQNRLVVTLAASGGGKTTAMRCVKDRYRVLAVCGESSETWRGSYFNAAADVALWLGIDETFNNPREVEAAVLKELSTTPRVLCIDEAHYCGPAALNLVKAILNKTPSRVVLFSIPDLWKRLEQKAYDEAKQLRRRTHAKFVVEAVEECDCRAFLKEKLADYASLSKAEEKEVVAACITAADRFGLYDTIERICVASAKEAKERPMSLDFVNAAIDRVEALRS